MPSRRAGAWRGAPLLPRRVQCPVCVCAALAAGLGAVGAGAGLCVFSVSPFSPRVSRAVCGEPSCLGVPYPRSLVRPSMRSVCSAGSVRLPFWYCPRALCVCLRSCSRGVRAPPPPRVGVARAPRAVPVLGAGRAVSRGPCPFASPALVPYPVLLATTPAQYIAYGTLTVGVTTGASRTGEQTPPMPPTGPPARNSNSTH